MRSPLGQFIDVGNRVVLRAADAVLASQLAADVVDRTLASPVAERALDKLLEQTVDRLLESEELWRLVDEIARSPSVTEAITKQSVGFADQVAGGVRARSMKVDARLERAARRALRRKSAAP